MKNRKASLFIALITLVVAISMAAAATYAWFTIAQTPEVHGIGISLKVDESELPFLLSLEEDGAYMTEVSLDSRIQVGDLLRPVSTADGVHWFTAKYGADGEIEGLNMFEKYEDFSNQGLSGNMNYIYYADIWVKCRDEKNDTNGGYTLHLNNPYTVERAVENKETVFGTFAVPQLSVSGGKYAENTGSAATSCRIGFFVYNYVQNGSDWVPQNTGDFWIFEPNADSHNFDAVEAYKSSGNIGYDQMSGNNYLIDGSGTTYNQVSKLETLSNGKVYETFLPRYDNGVIEMVPQSSLNTVRQLTSTWSAEKYEALNPSITDYGCAQLGKIGDFIKIIPGTSEFSVIDVSDTPAIATITTKHTQKIRVFFWIEGQDVDCWNDVISDSLFMNIEFRGQQAIKP